jgi:hypothetical protein
VKIVVLLFVLIGFLPSVRAETICGIVYPGGETNYRYLELSNGEVLAIEPRSRNKIITSLRESIIELLKFETKYCFMDATRTDSAIQNFSAVKKL